MIQNKFNNNVSQIKKAIDNDKLVIFAGAGVSKDSGIPLWGELINNLKGSLNGVVIDEDPLKIAQILYNEKGEKEYNDIIKNSLYKNQKAYNPIHEILFELNPQHIITTNYDNYFENIIENKGLPFSIVSKDIDLPYAEHKSLLIKYHGDFENKNIVFKETDYLEFSKNNTLKEIFVKSLFSNKVILFIGYGVGDVNLKLLIRDIQFILNKHHQRAYLLTHKTDTSDSEIKYFENLGINIINFCDDSLKDLKDNDKLSSVGNSVYKQLEYIRNFNLFEYEQSKNNLSNQSDIINRLHSSINRFYYFRVLPKRFIASLYPFNKDSKYEPIYNIESTTLVLYNKDIYDLINNYKGIEDENYSEEEKKKLNFIFSRLIDSNILHIGKKDGKKDSLGNQSTIKEIYLWDKYYSDNIKCECIDCNLNQFNYSDAISKIETYNISEESILWDDLVYAYSLYRIGEYYQSFKAYEKIEIKSNRLKQMDISFISLFNMKRMGIMMTALHGFDNRYNYKDLEKIENNSKKIDLDKELLKIKYFVDNDMFLFLKQIQEGIYIQRLCNKIDDLYNKVIQNVKLIENGGSSSNSNFYNIHNTVKELNSFLEHNFIIGNGFSSIEYSINKYIKTFILGFYIGTIKTSAYQNSIFTNSKVDSFDLFLFRQMVNYSEPKELQKFIIEQDISNIKFDENSQNNIIDYISNFFNSSFNRNTLFGGNYSNRIFINYLDYNVNFKSKILIQLKNICTILSFFDISEIQLNEIYSKINNFIKYTSYGERDAFDFLKILINKKYKLIQKDLLTETLNILNKKKLYFNQFYATLLNRINELDSKFINENINIDKIKDYEYGDIEFDVTIYYQTLPIEKQLIFISEIELKLENNSHHYTPLFLILYNKVPIKQSIINKYKQSIQKVLESENVYSKEDLNNYFLTNSIVQYFELIYSKRIKDNKISKLDVKNDFIKFIINPEKFDENLFEVQWLKVFHRSTFFKRFAKIDYIMNSLEEYLIKNNNEEEYMKMYFQLKNYKS